ncbi:uncharacterized protein ACLA_058540 [Aspergillus clavatus NRRL 1]|uniref:Pal1 cell morphology protein n=1 Tax=Aspergillus clavatus (strain ATCC 1007 / CBS 513.65 / DSM 816 / NCTC 3887 / NRRL 1 / QM 1276 / 107) TaxID=344612 RepID=A1C452_ASPCL|nr:uncharacterized protein ACLA_058540 [Aspergillus clavatus NRRL 1]EAW15192.1 conserved hypothetical protein [Aspergillus clavatus NRRL 1]
MPSFGDAMVMESYPSHPSHPSHHSHHSRYSHHSQQPQYPTEMGINLSLGSNNPYSRYASPTPSLSSSSSARKSVKRQRSSSLPSVQWNGQLEHHPPHPRRAQNVPPSYYPHNRQNSPRGPRPHPKYPRQSLLVNPDIIDRLDDVGFFQYHHEGPYDAVYAERNHDSKCSPIEALRESNEEALKATPKDKIADCLQSHRPLDGVAFYPPGTTDKTGKTYEYEEGVNMMNDYGNFTRCPGLKFTDEDFKDDPFYNTPLPKPLAALRKALSLRRCKRRGTS